MSKKMLDRHRKQTEHAKVDRKEFSSFTALHIGMAQAVLTNGWIQRKPIDSKPGSIDKHRGRTVDHISRSHLPGARLQEVFNRTWLAEFRYPLVNAKDRSN